MIDGSRLPLEDNIRLTLKAKELAAARDATLEAEIGRVGGDEGMGQVRDSCTRPEEALAFWRQTGVDALAVAIGNAHGNYRFAPELQFDILETIHNTVDCPLVLHGGTGISFADFRRTIDLGVRKINIDTDLRLASTGAMRRMMAEKPSEFDPRKFFSATVDAMKQICIDRYEAFGTAGNADKIRPISLEKMVSHYK